MADRHYLEMLTRRLADEGKPIEAGWVAMRLHVLPPNAPAAQLDDMRYAYMAGAQHLFASIMGMLDPGIDEIRIDLRRMDLIARELEALSTELMLKVGRPKGHA